MINIILSFFSKSIAVALVNSVLDIGQLKGSHVTSTHIVAQVLPKHSEYLAYSRILINTNYATSSIYKRVGQFSSIPLTIDPR